MSSFFDQLDAALREVAIRDFPAREAAVGDPIVREAAVRDFPMREAAPCEAGLPTPARPTSRRPRRRRRLLVAALASVSIGGTALAATGLWRPVLGEPGLGSPPTITANAPPPSQLAVLGVLRRPQTAADRSPATRDELQYMSSTASGVRTDYIRLLSDATGLGPAILVPVARLTLTGAPPAVEARFPHTDALCLLVGDRDGEGAGKRCFTTADVLAGRATLSLGTDLFGLVPDGVRLVSVSFANGASRTVSPASNFFELTAPGGSYPVAMTWTLADGQVRRFRL